VRLIDTHHLGREHVIGAWLVDDVLIDPGPASTAATVLDVLDGVRPRVIAVTHIHLDHAGATGTLVREWPDAEVWVHERGAPHLADPSRLLRSAARLYGDAEMDRLWGETLPVARERLRVLGDHDRLGDFESAYTPGHASHHVSYLHGPSRTVFPGDTAGVRIAGGRVRAPTPPPDIDLEAWAASLERIEAWEPAALAPTHFGRYEDVDAHLAGLRAYLAEWAPRARDLDQEAWIAEWLGSVAGEGEPPAVEQAMPPDQQYLGLARYHEKAKPA
jgi:glyoxylase-like metal-dependent hydrolase (beta-lactamase superfamily II)